MIADALVHGAVLCAFMSVIIFGSLWQDPRIWTASLPVDARNLAGPIPPRTQRRKRAWSILMLIGMCAIFGHLASRTGDEGFSSTAAAAFIAFQLYNLFDAVVIDLGLVIFRPRFAIVPGTEEAAGFRDPRWHLANYLKGVVFGVVFALLVAAIDAAVRYSVA